MLDTPAVIAPEDPLSPETLGADPSVLEDLSAGALLEWAEIQFGEGLAVSTSFGIQSAVTLHLVTRVRPDTPVIWVDTGYLPEETYQYAETLTRRLGLNLHVYAAELTPESMEERFGRLWETGLVEDLDLYDWVRKVEPFQRAMEELRPSAWVTGLRAEQTDHRRSIRRVQWSGERHKLAPILPWTSRDIHRYMRKHGLPTHPLWERGYVTVGDWHSSRPITEADADERATRFGGLKQECGLHFA